ncbi:hypothetical protein BC826DRAFT_1039806 [Russula brevipes]|nr:hypothetical protein BC826DRAFT_1039806 [Russula brevipes]
MSVPCPPYPSFTSAMSSAPFAAHDNMRLPAYRGSHLARFHPYPRVHPLLLRVPSEVYLRSRPRWSQKTMGKLKTSRKHPP